MSAHATARHRIDGVNFDVVAFNNFSRDHLDDFGDIGKLFRRETRTLARAREAGGRRGRQPVRSADCPRIEDSRSTLATEYGVNADWHLAITNQNLDGVSFVLQPAGAHFRGSVPVFGRFMAENAALALIMLHQAGSLDRPGVRQA